MFLDIMYPMSMNSPVDPKSMRALTDRGVLLYMLLSRKGILVPLWSVAERMRKGRSEGWSVVCSGTTCSVFRWVIAGDCRVNISFVYPTVLASSTKNLLVLLGMDFTIDLHNNPTWAFLYAELPPECLMLPLPLQARTPSCSAACEWHMVWSSLLNNTYEELVEGCGASSGLDVTMGKCSAIWV